MLRPGKELQRVCPEVGVPLAVIRVVLDYLLVRFIFRYVWYIYRTIIDMLLIRLQLGR